MKNISHSEKMFLSQIVALSQKTGSCFATNRYFKDFSDYSERSIERILRRLSDLGMVKVEKVQGYRQITPLVSLQLSAVPTPVVGLPDNMATPPDNMAGVADNLAHIESKDKAKIKETVSTPVAPKRSTVSVPKPTFNFETRLWDNITADSIKLWEIAYPACDINTELAKMAAWLIENPEKRKTRYGRFIIGWLARTQNHGGTK